MFPITKRQASGYRIFTQQEINQLKDIWGRREEIFMKERHYHYHKTGRHHSLSEAYKVVGISRVTYRKYEGKLFPLARRDEAGRRIFTKKAIEEIKELWENHRRIPSL